MKLHLIDVKVEHEEEVEWGTCELCMYIGPFDFPTYIFKEVETGVTHEVIGWTWGWGDLDAVTFKNSADFAAWVKDQDFDNPTFDYDWLDNIGWEYKHGKRHEQEGT